ncbi:hypothetical protein T11_1553 [Trichinella zimbabwensis]|uniref:Uncharacterized protein n=1 Tax=Trichinella zimbabwensis TaxID=268475 RepID=A0A0V1HD91_9BILA|nr:hypothetical protein T11_1553 [Trichinella zimbabwensis]
MNCGKNFGPVSRCTSAVLDDVSTVNPTLAVNEEQSHVQWVEKKKKKKKKHKARAQFAQPLTVNQCPQLTDDRWQKQKQQRQKKKKKKKKKGTNTGRKIQANMSYNNRASTLSNVEQTARLTVLYSNVHILNE